MREPELRFCGWAALLLWCAALFAPISDDGSRGWVLAVFGWLGPLGLAPGWYANIPFAINLTGALEVCARELDRARSEWLSLPQP
jgi:hypothetical protein